MMTVAANPIAFELPHTLMLLWLLAGCAALWIAGKLHVSTHKSVNILLPMAMGLMVFATYVTTRYNYDFLIDDVDIVQNNPHVVEADGWRTLWTSDYWYGKSTDDNLYRPVTILSYWVNARLPLCGLIVDGRAVEMYPRYFRGVNIVLLTGLAWLIALWLSHYVQMTAAWVVAFLFAGHAAHAEMVNYIVCRADLLAMLGIVGFLYMQRLAMEAGRWNWWQAVLAVISVIVAVGSKETGIIVLPAALAQAWIGVRTADTEVTDDLAIIPRSVHVGAMLMMMVPIALMLAARFSVVGIGVDYSTPFMDDLRDNPLRRVTTLERIPSALAIAWFYFKQLFDPTTTYYHLPDQLPTFGTSETILGITLLIVLVSLLVWYLRRHRWMAIGLIIGAGQYALVGNLLTPVGVYAANRLILPFSLTGCVLGAALIHAFCHKSTRRRAVVILPTIVVLAMMAMEIQNINFVWRTEARLMGRDLELMPEHPVAKYNFATVRAREAVFVDRYIRALTDGIDLVTRVQPLIGQPDGGPKADRDRLATSLEQIRAKLATMHETQQQTDLSHILREFVALLDRSILQDNSVLTIADVTDASTKLSDDLSNNLRLSDQYWGEATLSLEQVVAMRPNSTSAGIELGRVLELRGRKAQALKHYREMVNRSKDDSDVRIIEARIRDGRLCFELGVDLEGADRSLIIASKLLEAILSGDAPFPPGKRAELEYLHRNALRYSGLIAWRANNMPLALKRHDALLLRYPDFIEAKEDKKQWIEQLTPPDASGEEKPEKDSD